MCSSSPIRYASLAYLRPSVIWTRCCLHKEPAITTIQGERRAVAKTVSVSFIDAKVLILLDDRSFG